MNPNDLLLSTDYPLDKAILLSSFSIDFLVVGTTYAFNHNLPFIPLAKAVWSTEPDFSVVYDQGSGPMSTYASWPFLPQLVGVTADATTITLDFSNPDTVTKVYVRLYCFMPSNINATVNRTASAADSFTLNTDYNYTKLFKAGITAYSSVASSSEIIYHGLGYTPQVEIWYEDTMFGGLIRPLSLTNIADITSIYECAYSDSQYLYLQRGIVASTVRFHYRIYTDKIL